MGVLDWLQSRLAPPTQPGSKLSGGNGGGTSVGQLAGSEAPDFTEAYTSAKDGAENNWDDWDLSGIISADARVVFVAYFATTSTGAPGARTNGSSDERRSSGNAVVGAMYLFPVAPDDDGIIEIFASHPNNGHWRVMGWM